MDVLRALRRSYDYEREFGSLRRVCFGIFVDSHRPELRDHGAQDARQGHDSIPNAHLRLGCDCYLVDPGNGNADSWCLLVDGGGPTSDWVELL